VRVGVFFRGATVRCPSGMTDSIGPLDWIFGQNVRQIAKLAGGSAKLEAFRITSYSDSGGIVSAVLEAGEAFHNDRDAGLRADVTNDSTHKTECRG